MSFDPRLPYLPDGKDDAALTLGFFRTFVQRFYTLFREFKTLIDSNTPIYGSWTPVITFATPGNLSVSYSTQVGEYTKIGRLINANFVIITSAFTHTTASGNLKVTGTRFTGAATTGMQWNGAVQVNGVTKAGYTNFICRMSATGTFFEFIASGSGVSLANITASDTPTGGALILLGSITYTI